MSRCPCSPLSHLRLPCHISSICVIVPTVLSHFQLLCHNSPIQVRVSTPFSQHPLPCHKSLVPAMVLVPLTQLPQPCLVSPVPWMFKTAVSVKTFVPQPITTVLVSACSRSHLPLISLITKLLVNPSSIFTGTFAICPFFNVTFFFYAHVKKFIFYKYYVWEILIVINARVLCTSASGITSWMLKPCAIWVLHYSIVAVFIHYSK